MQFPPFKGVLAFDAVARLGSVNKAAEDLNLTVSAVSHQIALLESYVERRLFDRSYRGLTLTIFGERFRRDVAGALSLLATATHNARFGETSEVLRVHAVPSLAALWLMPRLSLFRAIHPDVRVHMTASADEVDFSRGEVDVDIRYGWMDERDVHAETLFVEEIAPLISPKLLANLRIEGPQDLLGQDLILSQRTAIRWPQWFAAHSVSPCPTEYVLSFDRTSIALEAAAKGLGIVLDSHRTAEGYLDRGDLVPVFRDIKGIAVHAHYLVYPHAHAKWSRVEKFSTWLRDEATQR